MPSGAALRNGRKTRKCAAKPNAAAISSAKISDGIIGQRPALESVILTGTLTVEVGKKSTRGRKNSPPLQALSKVKIPYIAKAPWAKLITPEPLKDITSPAPRQA